MDSKQETKRFYNRIAEQSFKEWVNNPALLPTLKLFINHLPDQPKVLDLGCGTGGESKRLYELGADVTGIDYSEESLVFARKHLPQVNFLLMDILKMDFASELFDGVMEAGVLFHFNKIEQDRILKKIYAILKIEGVFLSYYMIGDFEGIQEKEVSGEKFKRYVRRVSVDKWIKQVLACGFRDYKLPDFELGPFRCVEFYK